jgi:UDP-N-acetylglucosamine transferase subunit ALG13
MIFVMVGTHSMGFERLVKAMDEIAAKEKVVIQIGNTGYEPRNAEYFTFAGIKEVREYIKKADVVVTQGGIGSVTDSLRYGKPTVVVPRLKKYGEHTNDHQLDLTRELEEEGRIIAVYDIKDLPEAIEKARAMKPREGEKKEGVIGIIESYLEKI